MFPLPKCTQEKLIQGIRSGYIATPNQALEYICRIELDMTEWDPWTLPELKDLTKDYDAHLVWMKAERERVAKMDGREVARAAEEAFYAAHESYLDQQSTLNESRGRFVRVFQGVRDKSLPSTPHTEWLCTLRNRLKFWLEGHFNENLSDEAFKDALVLPQRRTEEAQRAHMLNEWDNHILEIEDRIEKKKLYYWKKKALIDQLRDAGAIP